MEMALHSYGPFYPAFAGGIRFNIADRPTAETVAGAVSRGLKRHFDGARHAAKSLAARCGLDPRTATKLIRGETTPSSPGLILLMREIQEVREEVLRLAGDMSAAEAARVSAALTQIEQTLNSIGRGGRQQ